MSKTEIAIDRLFRQEAGRAVATIAKAFGDVQIAEDAVQDAYLRLVKLSRAGRLPENATAWIMHAARNCAIDRLRRSETQRNVAERVAKLEAVAPGLDASQPLFLDDRLELIFACCHPALTVQSRVALTLRTVCGLTTKQIAAAFFVPETTMMRRLARAKAKLRESGISFELPSPERLADRLDSVLGVIYLIFSEGYKVSAGDRLMNLELCEEAVWLADLLRQLMPGEPESIALYCLLLFAHARHATRLAPDGSLATLEVQDRSRWDHDAIARAAALLSKIAPLPPTRFAIEAEIAGHHATAERYDKTDWMRIAALYEVLALINGSPAVLLNRSIAVGMAFGYERGLAALDTLCTDPAIREHYLLHAARADFLRRLGRNYEATIAYGRALLEAPTTPEQSYLKSRLSDIKPA